MVVIYIQHSDTHSHYDCNGAPWHFFPDYLTVLEFQLHFLHISKLFYLKALPGYSKLLKFTKIKKNKTTKLERAKQIEAKHYIDINFEHHVLMINLKKKDKYSTQGKKQIVYAGFLNVLLTAVNDAVNNLEMDYFWIMTLISS